MFVSASRHDSRCYRALLATVLWSCLLSQATSQEAHSPGTVVVAPASDDAARALSRFQIPSQYRGSLFAAEPLLANPVAFDIDARGRVFVCESYRQNRGVTDNRGHNQRWLDADLAAQTVADRIRYHRLLLQDKADEYTEYDDRIRRLEDVDGDGTADRSSIVAAGFHGLEEGTGAGVLVRDGDIYYTCIPHLWKLRDADDDGIAESRESLHSGYGVRVAFRGHDLHGLCLGHDGRIYFSIGDRGYHVDLSDRTLADPESGAVFRCRPDGSELEVVAIGLRNPQELAFDDYGNLFTGDNNSDSGDRARFVYVVRGSDSGWRMAYQYLPDRGPFNREKLWHPFHAEQPAFIVPPIDNMADGPSGLAFAGGVGVPEHLRGRFFLCDFRGTPANSGVRTIRVMPQGAFFSLSESEQTFWGVLATDVGFGPDGSVYISDWVDGWNGEGKGRIYRFVSEADAEAGLKMQQLLSSKFGEMSHHALQQLLSHADRRVRLEAQFALVHHNAFDILQQTAAGETQLLARLHAVWGLGQALRQSPNRDLAQTVLQLLDDEQPEVRAQAAWVLGEARIVEANNALVARLSDSRARVRYFAAQALGQLGNPESFAAVVQLLEENRDQDPMVRHGGVMALAGIGNTQRLAQLSDHASRSVRLAAVVALRKLRSPQIRVFLTDSDTLVAAEAIRAVHDVPITSALPDVAQLAQRPPQDEISLHRILNANFRLGTTSHAAAIAALAARSQTPETMRREALRMLADWSAPSSRDRVLGMWRPLPATRDAQPPRDALRAIFPELLTRGSPTIRRAALDAAQQLGLGDAAPWLKQLLAEENESSQLRGAALIALAALRDSDAKTLAVKFLRNDAGELRAAARDALAAVDPQAALPELAAAAAAESKIERQRALAALSELKSADAQRIVAQSLRELLADKTPTDTQLDVLEAARAHSDNAEIQQLLQEYQQRLDPNDPQAPYRVALEGGDAERGRQIFFERTEVSCVRCHKVDGLGGEVGPDLSKIGAQKERPYLLESIVEPNRTVAENYRSALVVDINGKIVNGIVKGDDDQKLTLMTAEGHLLTIAKDDIDERTEGPLAMPQDLVKHLSLRDVRDLVQWLKERQAP